MIAEIFEPNTIYGKPTKIMMVQPQQKQNTKQSDLGDVVICQQITLNKRRNARQRPYGFLSNNENESKTYTFNIRQSNNRKERIENMKETEKHMNEFEQIMKNSGYQNVKYNFEREKVIAKYFK